MTSRIQMDDIQYRLEIIKQELSSGGPELGKLRELIADCAKLRHSNPEGEFVGALNFIEKMLVLVHKNLLAQVELSELRKKLSA